MKHTLTAADCRKGAAVANGRKGAVARNAALTPRERSEYSRRAAEVRWRKDGFVPRGTRWEWDRTIQGAEK